MKPLNLIQFIIKRLWHGCLILIGVNALTFILFFKVNTVDDMARLNLGGKRVTQNAIEQWKVAKGYDLPLWFNANPNNINNKHIKPDIEFIPQQLTHTLFVQKSLSIFAFNLGMSDGGRDIHYDLKQRAIPSFILALPTFVASLLASLFIALTLLLFRTIQGFNTIASTILIILMSVSGLFYMVGGQWLFSKTLALLPISGYADYTESGFSMLRFLILPIMVGIASNLGGQARSYRLYCLEALQQDYVRTALSKGLSEWVVLTRHVLRNALIPILTGSVAVIPHLFTGSLMMESFFGIPGLGSYVIEAINAQDFAVVRVMVLMGAGLTVLGYALTDVAYSLADPRVRLA